MRLRPPRHQASQIESKQYSNLPKPNSWSLQEPGQQRTYQVGQKTTFEGMEKHRKMQAS